MVSVSGRQSKMICFPVKWNGMSLETRCNPCALSSGYVFISFCFNCLCFC